MASNTTATEPIPTSILHVARGVFDDVGSDPHDQGSLRPWLTRVLVSMTLLAMLATGLRIWSRRLNQQSLWWDDWLAIFNMVRNLVNPVSAPVTASNHLVADPTFNSAG